MAAGPERGESDAPPATPEPTPQSAASKRLQTAWQGRGWLAQVLRPVSWAYRAAWHLRRLLYRTGLKRSVRVPAVVVVVGNVVVGGGGKTPVVAALARHLTRDRHMKVGIVSRGYGRSAPGAEASGGTIEVHPDSAAATVGDEPLLLKRATGVPVFVGRDRAMAARDLLAAYPDTRIILCDDGLQHLALSRDIEICVLDEQGVGNGLLLPAGPLREPWPRKTDLLLHTGRRPAFAEGFRSRRELADYLLDSDGKRHPWEAVRGPELCAVAGIAHPEQFFQMLRERGVITSREVALPDHYNFSSYMPFMDKRYSIICTEKDAVKLWQHEPAALAAPLLFTAEPAFFQAFDRLVEARLSSSAKH